MHHTSTGGSHVDRRIARRPAQWAPTGASPDKRRWIRGRVGMAILWCVGPLQIGRIARVLRHRQMLRQVDVASKAGVSRLTIIKLEAGQAGTLTLHAIGAVFPALGGRIDLRPTWEGTGLDRLLDEGHASLGGRVVEILRRDGWRTEVEVTFSVYGDRGSIDILAWHPTHRHLLVVEIKTELGSVEGPLRPLDVKCRLARGIVRDRFSWQPTAVSRLVVMPEDSTIRRRVERHASVMDTAFPQRSREIRRWLQAPIGPMSGLWFLSEVRSANTVRNPSAIRRIRVAQPRSSSAA